MQAEACLNVALRTAFPVLIGIEIISKEVRTRGNGRKISFLVRGESAHKLPGGGVGTEIVRGVAWFVPHMVYNHFGRKILEKLHHEGISTTEVTKNEYGVVLTDKSDEGKCIMADEALKGNIPVSESENSHFAKIEVSWKRVFLG